MAAPPGHTFTRRALDAVAVAAHEREGIEPRGAIVTRVYRAYRDPAPVTVVPALLHAFSRVDVERGLGKRFTPWDDARRHAYAGLRPHLSGRDGATPRVTLPCRIGAPDAVANEVEVARVASGPLVSCLMVTRDRFDEASRAVHAWRRQTHSDRELVIIDHGRDDRLARLVDRLDDPRIRTRRLRERHARLGDLRNRALAEARGELVALWDDDDLHHAQRIELQVLALQGTSADACFLPRWIMHWSRRARFALSQSRAWEGSMLAKRRLVPPYPSRRMAEDTPVVRALRERARVVYLDLPGLYVYRIHGANTWHDEHFERFWRDAARRFEGADAAAVALMLSQEHDLPTPIVPSPRERWRDAARHLRALRWQAREAVVTRLRGWRRD